MSFPKCNHCGKELKDWEGNVMVNERRLLHDNSIDSLEVICKKCTPKLGGAGTERSMHALWELRYIKNNFLTVLASVFADLTQENPSHKWSKEAVNDFWRLGVKAFPDQAKELIGF